MGFLKNGRWKVWAGAALAAMVAVDKTTGLIPVPVEAAVLLVATALGVWHGAADPAPPNGGK